MGEFAEGDEFEALFENATQDFHSFLAVDLSQKDPNKVFSKDLSYWYQVKNVKNKVEREENIHHNAEPETPRIQSGREEDCRSR